MTKGIFISLMLIITVSSATYAMKEGGGGDMCEDRIKVIRDDIQEWIKNNGPKGLSLPSDTRVDQYSQAMLDQISQAQIRCVGQGDEGYPVRFNGIPKVCKFDLRSEQITCDFAKFNATNESDQYNLIHHEYAGLAQIELPNGADSNYQISNQISAYLVDQVVKKLAVKPRISTTNPGVIRGSIEALRTKCEDSLDEIFNRMKQAEIDSVRYGLSHAQSELMPASVDAKLSFSFFMCPKMGFAPSGLLFQNVKKLTIQVTTVMGVHLEGETCLGTVNPVFLVKSDSAGRPEAASCLIPNNNSGSLSYNLMNSETSTPVRKSNPSGSHDFGGFSDSIVIFQNAPILK